MSRKLDPEALVLRLPREQGLHARRKPLKREIRRRTDVVGIFPNRDAIVRLVGAVLCEINDDWAVIRRYMTLNREEAEPEQKALKPAPKKAAA